MVVLDAVVNTDKYPRRLRELHEVDAGLQRAVPLDSLTVTHLRPLQSAAPPYSSACQRDSHSIDEPLACAVIFGASPQVELKIA